MNRKPFELKVEVIWGRAYLAFIETRQPYYTFFGLFPLHPISSLVALRDCKLPCTELN